MIADQNSWRCRYTTLFNEAKLNVIFFPFFSPIKPAHIRLAKARLFLSPRESDSNVLECGSGMSKTRLVIGNGVNLPIDIRVHVSEKDGTTTWYSELSGDKGCYLRRYANGKFSIHLGTWHSEQQLHAALEEYSEVAGDAWTTVYKAALPELKRRIKSLDIFEVHEVDGKIVDELQAAREELAELVGHVAAVEVVEPEIPWVATPIKFNRGIHDAPEKQVRLDD